MEKMEQTWLDRDICDECGEEISYGEPIFLDVEHEHNGIIPAYCSKCAKK